MLPPEATIRLHLSSSALSYNSTETPFSKRLTVQANEHRRKDPHITLIKLRQIEAQLTLSFKSRRGFQAAAFPVLDVHANHTRRGMR